MKRIHIVRVVQLALAVGLSALSDLRAQDGRLALEPPLSQVFPFETLADGVHVEYPVLVNDHTILRPEAILRFIYLDPNAAASRTNAAGDDPGPGFKSHVGAGGVLKSDDTDEHSHDTGQSGGWGTSDGDTDATRFDEKKSDAKRRKNELQNEVWRQRDLFSDALDHAMELGTIMVYSVPAHPDPMTTALDLPEGMLLGEVQGHVRVLGLQEDSRAFTAGIRPGDEIRSFSANAPVKDLNDFMRQYIATKHQAKITGDPTYVMGVWRPASGQEIPMQIAAPPTLPSFLNDSYSSPVDKTQ